jgi:uncharacterized cupredoxin-like copper-binding protein
VTVAHRYQIRSRMPRYARQLILGAAFALLAALPACSTKDVLSQDEIGYVPNVESRLAEVDWNKAETVNIKLTEWRYEPARLKFQRGKPYRLHVENTGIEPHDFSSKTFFQAIATAKLVGPGGTMDKPHLVTIGVDDGQSKDLYFVPVRAGTYAFECEEPLHATFGMRGTAEID